MLEGARVLIVEAEYLIALDIQRVLESVMAGPVVFARSPRDAEGFAGDLEAYDLAIIDVPVEGAGAIAFIGRLFALGVPCVAMTASGAFARSGIPGAAVPVLGKPFAEAALIAACAKAVGRA